MSTQSPFQPAEQVKCDRYYTERNRTHIIYGGYEGIPENLLINFVIWVVCTSAYLILNFCKIFFLNLFFLLGKGKSI